MRRLLILFLTLSVIEVKGEYRAYELQMRNPEVESEPPIKIISTLDQFQYPFYYHIPGGYIVEYVDSWMCWGRTGGYQTICDKPEARIGGQPEAGESASNQDL